MKVELSPMLEMPSGDQCGSPRSGASENWAFAGRKGVVADLCATWSHVESIKGQY